MSGSTGATGFEHKDRSRFGRPSNTAPKMSRPPPQQSLTRPHSVTRPTQASDEVPSRMEAEALPQDCGPVQVQNAREEDQENSYPTVKSLSWCNTNSGRDSKPLGRSAKSENESGDIQCGDSADSSCASKHRLIASEPELFLLENAGQELDDSLDSHATGKPKNSVDGKLMMRKECKDASNFDMHFNARQDQHMNSQDGALEKELGWISNTGDDILHPNSNFASQIRPKFSVSHPGKDMSAAPTTAEGLAQLDSAQLSALICGSCQVGTQKRWEVLEQSMTLCAKLHRRGRWQEMGHILYNLALDGSSEAGPCSALSSRSQDFERTNNFLLGDTVVLKSGMQWIGTVRYFGPVAFSDGDWVGLELDRAAGKNNGTVNGIPYFACPDMHGLFVRAPKLRVQG